MNDKKSMSPVEFIKFLDELEKERDFYVKEGIPSKAQIADLSLQVAEKTGDVIPFTDRKRAKQVVLDTFPELPEERVEDVGKMLHVVVRDLNIDITSSGSSDD